MSKLQNINIYLKNKFFRRIFNIMSFFFKNHVKNYVSLIVISCHILIGLFLNYIFLIYEMILNNKSILKKNDKNQH